MGFPFSGEQILRRAQDRMPPDLAYSDLGAEILRVISDEMELIQAAVVHLQEQCFVATADSDGLVIWEQELGLPVDPTDVDIEERRAVITQKLIQRFVFYGMDLRAGIEKIAGPIMSTTVDATNGIVVFNMGTGASQYALDQAQMYCRQAGLAHIQYELVSPSGSTAFLINVSTVNSAI